MKFPFDQDSCSICCRPKLSFFCCLESKGNLSVALNLAENKSPSIPVGQLPIYYHKNRKNLISSSEMCVLNAVLHSSWVTLPSLKHFASFKIAYSAGKQQSQNMYNLLGLLHQASPCLPDTQSLGSIVLLSHSSSAILARLHCFCFLC